MATPDPKIANTYWNPSAGTRQDVPIRFGDILRITEADDVSTDWRLTLEAGEPRLRPAHLPIIPGLYHADGHLDPAHYRKLVLTAEGRWFWLDITGTGRDAVLVPVSEGVVAGYVLTPAVVAGAES